MRKPIMKKRDDRMSREGGLYMNSNTNSKKGKRGFKKLITGMIAAAIAVVLCVTMIPQDALAAMQTSADQDTSTTWQDDNFLGHEYSTEFAGRVWSDKSVSVIDGSKTDFEVKYSTLATSKSVTGQTQAPLDVVFVIDISGSMANNNSGMPEDENDRNDDDDYTRMYYTVEAVNDSIEAIMAMNEHTRVGVVFFSTTATTVLPLGHYNKSGSYDYLTINRRDPRNIEPYAQITVRAQGRTARTYDVEGGTNIQQGIYTGAALLANASSTKAIINGQEVSRIPALVLLSDGSPTYSSNSDNWWAPNASGGRDGNGNGTFYGNGMKAMMVGAYMKQAINNKYGVTDANSPYAAKIHTIGMGIEQLTGNEKNLAYITLNPGEHYNDNNTMANNIRSRWNEYIRANNQSISVQVNDGTNDTLRHPSSEDDIKGIGISSWVNQYHKAEQADSVANVFSGIVQELALSVPEVPTEVKRGETLANGGYLTYKDPIGHYMVVKGTTMKFDYWDGSEYKTYEATDADGNGKYEFASDKKVVGSDGQEYSLNNVKITVTTDADGFQTLEVQIPAVLIPLRVNEVKLNEQGQITSHTHNNEQPCSLRYTVGLLSDLYDEDQQHIRMIPVDSSGNEWTGDKLTAYQQYFVANENASDGTVNFYSNLFTGKNVVVNNKTGQPHTVGDAYVSFEPAHTNAFYYIQEDTLVYTNQSLTTVATGTIDDNATYYYKETFYHEDDVVTQAVARTGRQLKSVAIERNAAGQWYRPEGSVRLNKLQLFENQKDENVTGTAEDWYASVFHHAEGDPDPANGHFDVHLGNNGVLKARATGNVEIAKVVTADDGLTAPDKAFTFKLGLSDATNSYAYNILDEEGAVVKEGTIKNNDTFTLKDGQKMVIMNLLPDVKYTVTETQEAGFTTKATLNNSAVSGMAVSGTIVAGEVDHVLYTNHYDVTDIIVNEGNTTVDFGAKKVISGRDWTEGLDTYTFILESNRATTPMPVDSTPVPNETNPTHYLKEVIVDTADKAAGFGFGEITYDRPGTYTYTISERVPATGLPGISYSGAMYQVVVEITDNGDGTLSKAVTMTHVRNDAGGTTNLKPVVNNTAEITNTFSATSVAWTPVGTKDYTDNSGTNTLRNGMFEFTMRVSSKSPANTPMPESAVNGIAHDVNIGPQIGYDYVTFTKDHLNPDGSEKSYFYEFAEVIPEGATRIENSDFYTLNGMTYDGGVREVEVKVSLSDDGKIVISPVYETEVDGIHYNRVVFFNTYTPDETAATISASKVLTGRAWKAGDAFTFTLSTADAATQKAISDGIITGVGSNMNSLATKTVTAQAGTLDTPVGFAFDSITFTKPGTYRFNITETAGNIPGMTYDTHTARITVVVADKVDADGNKLGELEATVNGTATVFTNTYDAADSAPLSLVGTKTLSGRDMRTGEFFLNVSPQPITEGSDVLAPMGNSRPGNSVPAAEDGVASEVTLLNNVVYTEPGTYVYLIKENIPTDAQKLGGITYDENTVYRVTVTVTDDTNGKLIATPVIHKSTDKGVTFDEANPVGLDGIAFNNTYATTDAVYTPLALGKELTGKELVNGEFTFKMKSITNPNNGMIPPADTVTNDANGYVRFGDMKFTAPGTYQIEIKEVSGTNPGMTYSDNVLKVEYIVSDDGYGKLVVEESVIEGETIFYNVYNTVGDIDLTVNKNYVDSINGSDNSGWNIEDNTEDAFTFILQPADDATKLAVTGGIVDLNGAGNGTPQSLDVTISETDDVKAKTFENITVHQAGTYVFTLFEVTDNPIEGVHYDATPREITITATDNGNGTLTMSSNVTDNTITFKNVYDTNETFVYGWDDLQVTKDLTGRDWKAGETYAFTLAGYDAATKTAISEGKVVLGNATTENPKPTSETITMNKDNRFTLSFGDIVFHSAGTYSFIVTEDTLSVGATAENRYTVNGVTYDTSEEIVTITVADADASASTVLKVTSIAYGDDTDPDKIHFVNKYDSHEDTLEGSTNFKISKQLVGRKWNAEDEFTFTMKLVNKDTLEETTSEFVSFDKDKMTITFTGTGTEELNAVKEANFGDVTFTEEGVYYFLIEEQIPSETGNITYADHERIVRVDVVDSPEQIGQLVATPSYFGESTFINTYTPDPLSVTLKGTKTLKGRDLTNSDRFRFDIAGVDGAPMPDMTLVTTSEVINANTRKVEFGPIIFTSEGTYNYIITEQTGSINGVTYDTTVWNATVDVTYDDTAGVLNAVVSYTKDEPVTTDTGVTEPETGFAFTNEYKAEATDPVKINATKTISPSEGNSLELTDNLFKFKVALEGEEPTYVGNTADGNVVLLDGVTYDQPDTYVYTVNEVDTEQKGVQYDGDTYVITVVVTDNYATGKLDKTVTITKDGTVVDAITFDNGYNPDATFVTIDGKKILTGGYKDINADEFTFKLTPTDRVVDGAVVTTAAETPMPVDEEGNILDTVKNLADGTFQFEGITYTHVGTYAYEVSEVNEGKTGYTYDAEKYVVTVDVTDVNGELVAAVTGVDDANNNPIIVFTNDYTPIPLTTTISGTKTLTGRDMAEGEFTFKLIAGDEVVDTATNTADGSFTLNIPEITDEGTYTYAIIEDKAGATVNGLTYDDGIYTVILQVEDVDGRFVAVEKAVLKEQNEAEAITFENIYTADATSVQLGATKVLTGRDLEAGEFTFLLTGNDGTTLTAVNGADGSVLFDTIQFTEAGTYTYVITEAKGNAEYVTYDGSKFTVTVVVTDDLKGNLVAEITSITESVAGRDIAASKVVFENTYEVPKDTSPKTNDIFNLWMLLAVICAAGFGLFGATVYSRRS